MFDWVEFETECPKCKAKMNGFQSKDLFCELVKVKPWEVSNFYSSCDNCGTWVEYARKHNDPSRRIIPPEPPNWRDDFVSIDRPKFHDVVISPLSDEEKEPLPD